MTWRTLILLQSHKILLVNILRVIVGLVRATKNQFVYTLNKSTKMIVVVDMTKVNNGCKKNAQ